MRLHEFKQINEGMSFHAYKKIQARTISAW